MAEEYNIYFDEGNAQWYLRFRRITRVPINGPGIKPSSDFKYWNAGENWVRIETAKPFQAYRYFTIEDDPTGNFFTSSLFSSTANAQINLNLTGWSIPNYKTKVTIKPTTIYVGYIPKLHNIQFCVPDKSTVDYKDPTATNAPFG